MLRRMLFSALAALVLAGGLMLASAFPGNAAPLMSVPAAHAQTDNGLIEVRSCGPWNNWCQPMAGPRCGPWNNWCGRGSECGRWNNWCGRGPSGNSACIMLGGVQFCVGNNGSNCHWQNGRKYCDNGRRPGGDCVQVNGHRYCTFKHYDCVRVNGRNYCRY